MGAQITRARINPGTVAPRKVPRSMYTPAFDHLCIPACLSRALRGCVPLPATYSASTPRSRALRGGAHRHSRCFTVYMKRSTGAAVAFAMQIGVGNCSDGYGSQESVAAQMKTSPEHFAYRIMVPGGYLSMSGVSIRAMPGRVYAIPCGK